PNRHCRRLLGGIDSAQELACSWTVRPKLAGIAPIPGSEAPSGGPGAPSGGAVPAQPGKLSALMRNSSSRILVTGIGPVTAFGVGIDPLWSAMVEGRSAVGRIRRFDPAGFSCQVAAEMPDGL